MTFFFELANIVFLASVESDICCFYEKACNATSNTFFLLNMNDRYPEEIKNYRAVFVLPN